MNVLGTLVPAPLRPAARKVKRFFRGLERVRVDAPLAADGCRGAVDLLRPAVLPEKGRAVDCPVRVRNLGTAAWSSDGACPVRLNGRWLTTRREPFPHPGVFARLPHPVRPGESAVVDLRLSPPPALGHFLLELELAQDGGPAFRDAGSKPALLDVQVVGRAADDIDYHKVYATADLGRDHWTVVGPSTKEEFDTLSRVKLEHLVKLGLTPDSKVLDVGCGTGQVTVAMEGFLSDAGFYYGTDVGPEAIEYCNRRFTRPNFRFAVNDMTRVPDPGVRFDMAVYFSVFTHTYPDETALLLAETKRLMAPGGAIYADWFTSPLVDRYAGNRGAVELNLEHMLRLVDLVGLETSIVSDGPWQTHGRREFRRFVAK